jgi:hypothetical protein
VPGRRFRQAGWGWTDGRKRRRRRRRIERERERERGTFTRGCLFEKLDSRK